MCVRVGQVITILEQTTEDWWEGEFEGKSGFVPKVYVELIGSKNTPTIPTSSSHRKKDRKEKKEKSKKEAKKDRKKVR